MSEVTMADDAPSKDVLENIASLQEEASRQPDDRDLQRKLAWALYGAGRFEEARDAFEKARERWPDDIEFHYGLGLSLKQLGQKEVALTEFEKALATGERSVQASMLRRLAEEQRNILMKGAA